LPPFPGLSLPGIRRTPARYRSHAAPVGNLLDAIPHAGQFGDDVGPVVLLIKNLRSRFVAVPGQTRCCRATLRRSGAAPSCCVGHVFALASRSCLCSFWSSPRDRRRAQAKPSDMWRSSWIDSPVERGLCSFFSSRASFVQFPALPQLMRIGPGCARAPPDRYRDNVPRICLASLIAF